MRKSANKNLKLIFHYSVLAALPAAIAGTWQTIFSAILANYWAKKSKDKVLPLEPEYMNNK